jgi:phosphatidate cytidylyltransferase
MFINRRKEAAERRDNWLKYFVYLSLFLGILTVMLTERNLLLAFTVVLLSGALFEILLLKKTGRMNTSQRKALFAALLVFSSLAVLFGLFILLPQFLMAWTYTVVVIFDGSGQLVGQLLGKRRILPSISPGKTWEGWLGGTVSAVLTGMLLYRLTGSSPATTLLLAFIVCMAAFAGDTAASLLKRRFGVKDFSRMLPGQGGLLDRFDSLIPAGAVITICFLPAVFSAIDSSPDIAVYLGYTLSLGVLLLFCELLHSVWAVRAEYTRALSHILSGLACLFLPVLFTSAGYVAAFCIQSSLFLLFSRRLGLLASHHGVERETRGSPLFFAGILFSFFMSKLTGDPILFILPVAILSLSDPLAAMAGMMWERYLHKREGAEKERGKTIAGSLIFFLSSFSILLAGLIHFAMPGIPDALLTSALVAFASTLAEAWGRKGNDNLFIPMAASVSMFLLGLLSCP